MAVTRITIPYGEGVQSCEVSSDRNVVTLTTKLHEMQAELPEMDIIRNALASPIGTLPLRQLAAGKKTAVVITSDHTRPVPSHLTLPLMLEEMRIGSPDIDITIIIAVGSHRATTSDEMIGKFGRAFVAKEKIIVHDPYDDEKLVHVGILPSGGELIVNRLAVEAELLVSDGFIEPHVFAGFSGGRKSVLPGIASFVTVMANHNAEFMVHPNSRVGVLEGNPIHEDMIFAARAVGLDFILNVVIDGGKKVVAAFAGDADKAHREGCSYMDGLAGVDAVPAPIVITSNGGYPADQNLFQSVKSIMAAVLTCAPGGVIIACNECRDGHGSDSFYRTFAEANSVSEVLRVIMSRKRNETVPDQWVNQFLGQIIMRNKVITVADDASKELVEGLKMSYAASLQEAIEMAERYLGQSNAPITVIPNGVSVMIRQK